MAAYQYSALDASGNEKKGIIEADSQRQVRQKLRQNGWIPTSVKEANQNVAATDTNQSARLKLGRRQIKHHDVVLLTRQLATLLESGTPVEESLNGVAEQTERPRVKLLLMAIRSRVLEGHSLATGFSDFPQIFNEMYCATVSAGEESGRLADVLKQLADFTEKQQVLRQKVVSSAIYPCLMILVSIAIVVFLLSYVVPQLVSLFKDSGQQLPLLTRSMIALSDAVKAYGIYVGICLVILIWGLNTLIGIEQYRRKFHALMLKLPVVGKMLKVMGTARYARTLGILITSGVPVLDAMRASAKVVIMMPVRESLLVAATQVREGMAIHTVLKNTHYFPPMSVHLIATGETSGRLQQMLTKAAETQERDVEMMINNLVNLFEPMMTLVMGTIVLLIVLSVLLPIFSLSQAM